MFADVGAGCVYGLQGMPIALLKPLFAQAINKQAKHIHIKRLYIVFFNHRSVDIYVFIRHKRHHTSYHQLTIIIIIRNG